MKVKVEVDVYDDEMFCHNRNNVYQKCKWLKLNDWSYCYLFDEKVKVDIKYRSLKCDECKSYIKGKMNEKESL